MAAGADVSIATPWPVRRCDKSDFNDVIRAAGTDAVRIRIAMALNPAHEAVNRLPVNEGRTALRAAVDGLFAAERRYDAKRKHAEAQAKADLTADAPFAAEVIAARQARAEHRAAVAEARRLSATNASRATIDAAKAAASAARDRSLIASEIAAEFKAETQKLQREILAAAKLKGRSAAGPYPVHAIKVDVGAGKSEASLVNVVSLIHDMRAAGDKRTVVIAIPAHDLGDQQVARLAAMPGADGIVSAVWRSRKAKQTMCFDLDAVADAEEALADVQKSVCRQEMADGSIRECKFFAECPFQAQRNMKPDVWFIAHELLFGQKPGVIETPAVLVVDESAWQDGLFGTVNPIKLLLETLISESATVPGEPLASAQLRSTRAALHAALSGMACDGDTLLPAIRSELIAQGITAAGAREAYAAEWTRKIEADIYPGMPPKGRKDAVQAVIHNKLVAKLGMLWKAVAHLVADGGPERSGCIGLGMSKTTEGTAPAIHIKGRKDVHESWHVPTLLMDATMQPDLVRPFWPTMKLTADIRLQTPHQHVIQVIDRAYSKAQLAKETGRRDVHAILCREARRHGQGRVLTVVQKGIEEQLPDVGPLPVNMELAHHNAVAGRDEWGPGPDRKGITSLIVVGRTAPSPEAVEAAAEALTGAAIDRLPGWYDKAEGAREMADGTVRTAETDRHPNPIAEAIRWQIVEGELVQIIGRARGVNRTEANPVDVLVMTNAPLPVPVDHCIGAGELDPSPGDLMMAAGGVALASSTQAATAYPGLWGTGNAAKLAMARGGCHFVIRVSNYSLTPTSPRSVRFQLAGLGQRPSVATFDPRTVPDIAAWLETRLGKLARCEVMPEATPQPEPAPEPEPAAAQTGADAERLDPATFFPVASVRDDVLTGLWRVKTAIGQPPHIIMSTNDNSCYRALPAFVIHAHRNSCRVAM
jgi:putative DNA primase/helicase